MPFARQYAHRLITLTTILLAATSGPAALAKPAPGFANPDLRVTAAWLHQHLHDADLLVVDARPADDYRQGHIPGALSVPLAETRGMEGLRDPQGLAAYFAGKGVGTSQRVVVYDKGGQPTAPRLFWTLEYLGHPRAAVLDGGLAGWQQAGGTLSDEMSKRKAGTFVAKVQPGRLLDRGACAAAVGDPHQVVLDARSPEEFSGEQLHAKRGGHVPGAVNVDWQANFAADGVTLKPAAELQALYEQKGVTRDKAVVAHCQSGNRASVSYWVLRLLGYPKVGNYAPGWSEWGNDPVTPVEQGTPAPSRR